MHFIRDSFKPACVKARQRNKSFHAWIKDSQVTCSQRACIMCLHVSPRPQLHCILKQMQMHCCSHWAILTECTQSCNMCLGVYGMSAPHAWLNIKRNYHRSLYGWSVYKTALLFHQARAINTACKILPCASQHGYTPLKHQHYPNTAQNLLLFFLQPDWGETRLGIHILLHACHLSCKLFGSASCA